MDERAKAPRSSCREEHMARVLWRLYWKWVSAGKPVREEES